MLVIWAGKTLNPYQGLKRIEAASEKRDDKQAGKTLNPYQGLKLAIASFSVPVATAGKTLNPYQGLKLAVVSDNIFYS